MATKTARDKRWKALLYIRRGTQKRSKRVKKKKGKIYDKVKNVLFEVY